MFIFATTGTAEGKYRSHSKVSRSEKYHLDSNLMIGTLRKYYPLRMAVPNFKASSLEWFPCMALAEVYISPHYTGVCCPVEKKMSFVTQLCMLSGLAINSLNAYYNTCQQL